MIEFVADYIREDSWILTLIIFLPAIGALMIMLPSRTADRSAGPTALLCSFVTLLLTCAALVAFYAHAPADEFGSNDYLLRHYVPWISTGDTVLIDAVSYPTIDIAYRVGVDGISMWLLVLSALLMPIAILSSFTGIRERRREYYAFLLLLQTGLMGVFCSLDLLLFYVFFEFTLIPLYFIVGIWGGPNRRKAANKLFIFTLAGSVLTFAGVVFLAYWSGKQAGYITLNIQELVRLGQRGYIPTSVQMWVFLAFAAGFAVKVPLFPVHTWLPLAHTEAPTAGSVILAGVLLKLGTYGFCRISLAVLPIAAVKLGPLFAVLAIIGIIYAALAAWVQTDVKKLVAYSSVSHLGFCMLGLFSMKIAGATGGVLYMINHGLSTGALFLIVGFVYERYHTRDINKIGGLARQMPWLAFFLVFFTLSSIGLPGLNGFVSEFLVLLGTATSGQTTDRLVPGPLGYGYAIPAAMGIILGAVYMLWMCQRVLFGPLKEPPNTPDLSAGLTKDLTRREKGILVPLALCCIVLGVYPKPLLETFEIATRQHILIETVAGYESVVDSGLATVPVADERATECPTVGWPMAVAVGDANERAATLTALEDSSTPPSERRGTSRGDAEPEDALGLTRSADVVATNFVMRGAQHGD